MTDLGRRIQHDPRSRQYAYPTRGITAPRSVRHLMPAPHVDQFYTSGCVGFSGVNMLNCTTAIRSRTKWNALYRHGSGGRSFLGNDDGLDDYSGATRYDEFPGQYPPTDDGSSALGLMKFWKTNNIITGYDWTFTFDAFLAALQRQPVLVGTNWYDDMMSTAADGVVHSDCSKMAGGHEYLATQIIGPKKLLGFEQSWGENPPGFGKHGRFWMGFGLAKELIIAQQGDVAVPRFL